MVRGGQYRSSIEEKWRQSRSTVLFIVCVFVCFAVYLVYLHVHIVARDCLFVSHVRFYERVGVHHQRWWERWKVVGITGRFQRGGAELTDIQEELVVALLPLAELPGGQTGLIQNLTDYGQVTFLSLLWVKEKSGKTKQEKGKVVIKRFKVQSMWKIDNVTLNQLSLRSDWLKMNLLTYVP